MEPRFKTGELTIFLGLLVRFPKALRGKTSRLETPFTGKSIAMKSWSVSKIVFAS